MADFVQVLERRRLFSVLRVDVNSPAATPNGATWGTAYRDLAQALSVSASGDQIWVADGTYKPTTSTNRASWFLVKSGIALYGGYAGYGAANPDARDVVANATVLSGDIGVPGDSTDNCWHVISANNTTSATQIDGFSVSDGAASGAGSDYATFGGGILAVSGSPTISRCNF